MKVNIQVKGIIEKKVENVLKNDENSDKLKKFE